MKTVRATAALITVLALAGCGTSSSDGPATSSTGTGSSGASDTGPGATGSGATGAGTSGSTTSPVPGSTSTSPAASTPAPSSPPAPSAVPSAPLRLYSYEPGGAKRSPWEANGAKAGVITRAGQVADVVRSFDPADRPAVQKALDAAAAQEPPSARHPWYVFDATGCQFTLTLRMQTGNPVIVVTPPKAQQPQCFAPEWRAAVYRYDASAQTTAPPAFTAPR